MKLKGNPLVLLSIYGLTYYYLQQIISFLNSLGSNTNLSYVIIATVVVLVTRGLLK